MTVARRSDDDELEAIRGWLDAAQPSTVFGRARYWRAVERLAHRAYVRAIRAASADHGPAEIGAELGVSRQSAWRAVQRSRRT